MQQLEQHPDKPLVASMTDAARVTAKTAPSPVHLSKLGPKSRQNSKLDLEGLEAAVIPLLRSPSGQSLVNLNTVRSFGDLNELVDPEPRVHLTDIHDGRASDTESASPDSDNSANDSAGSSEPSLFDTTLLSEWDARQEQGLFRYKVAACESKVVEGRYGFVAQLNEGRAQNKRPTEFSVDKVMQSFDERKFNFKKASQDEVIFQFGTNCSDGTSFAPHAAVTTSESHMVLINVSPIEYGHVLLVPRILDSLPQQIEQPELLLALQMAKSSDNPYMRVGYNSLGAYATINHLHFQAYYLMAPFPVERAPTRRLSSKAVGRTHGVHVSTVEDYPCKGLVFEGKDRLHDLAQTVSAACKQLQEANIPFNLLVVDCGSRVFLFPQCFAERKATSAVAEDILDTQVNPACFEICGHMVLKRRQDYDEISEAFVWRILSAASLDDTQFAKVLQLIRQD
jgi:GDP-L-galactose phosphorylase